MILSIFFIVLQISDVYITSQALEAGAIERNPIISELYKNGVLFVYAYKLFFALLIIYAVRFFNLWIKELWVCNVWMIVLDVVYLIICINNYIWYTGGY